MTFEERVKNTFDLDEEKIGKSNARFKEENELLQMEIDLDMSKYKNIFSSYSEVLKEYYPKSKINVLTKIKENRGFDGIIASLFKSSKKSVMSQMRTFSPNYLIENKNRQLLVTIEDCCLKVYEIPKTGKDKFIFRGYRYKIANEIKLR